MRGLITGRRIWLLAAVLGGMLWLALLPALARAALLTHCRKSLPL